jgi:Uma2 family endonuclease
MPELAAHGPYTWDDFVALDEDDRRELIDGELVETEVPRRPHERIVVVLSFYLEQWSRAGNGGEALASGYKIRITSRRGFMPDVQFYRRGNDAAARQENGLVDGRPDLVVEILSPSSARFDRVTKLNGYASKGVSEYWLVDPAARTLEQLVLKDGAYSIEASLAEDATFEPRTFSGLVIPLAELWAQNP